MEVDNMSSDSKSSSMDIDELMDPYHSSTDITTISDTDDSDSDAESPRKVSHADAGDPDACPLEKIIRDSKSCDIADARTRINFQMSYPW